MRTIERWSLLSNLMLLGGSRVAATAMNLATASYLAKVLGATNFGIHSFAIAYVSYFLIVVNLGYEAYLSREIAYRPGRINTLVNSALVMRLLIASVMAIVLVASLFMVGLTAIGQLVVLIQGSVLFSTAINLTCVYQGLQRMQVVAAREFLVSIRPRTNVAIST